MVGTKVVMLRTVRCYGVVLKPGEVFTVSDYRPGSCYPVRIQTDGLEFLLYDHEVRPLSTGLFV